ncbi:MAG: sirohydrochlorin cobaltochelatase, partial [Ezakiella sp.]
MKGITVCFFGTTHMDTYDACIKPIYDFVKNNYGNEYEVEMAYTSRIIKKRLKERGILDVKNERDAL